MPRKTRTPADAPASRFLSGRDDCVVLGPQSRVITAKTTPRGHAPARSAHGTVRCPARGGHLFSEPEMRDRNLFMPSCIQLRVIEREAIAPMPINDMVLTVAVMTFAFLDEVA